MAGNLHPGGGGRIEWSGLEARYWCFRGKDSFSGGRDQKRVQEQGKVIFNHVGVWTWGNRKWDVSGRKIKNDQTRDEQQKYSMNHKYESHRQFKIF